METEKKIFFTDLDGTLLNDQKEITAGNMTAIQEALDRGHKVVLSTGRALSSAISQAEKLGLTMQGCYIIAFDGGVLYDSYERKVLAESRIPAEFVRHLFAEASRLGVHLQAYAGSAVLAPEVNEKLKRYASITKMECGTINPDTDLNDGTPKLLAVDYESREPLDTFDEAIRDWAKGKVDTFYSCPQYLEIVPPGVSKGNAIRELCGMLEVPLANTVSAGDADNDISMLQTTPVSAVMRNAAADMYQYGTYITQRDNNHDGVEEIIRKFILEGQGC